MNARIVFLDMETTGLDAEQNEIVEVCAMQWNGPGAVGPSFSARIMPRGECDPRAAAVNGFDRGKWANSGAEPYSAAIVGQLAALLDGAIVAGANPAFDRAFVAAEARRLGFDPPRWSHRNLDVQSLAVPLLVRGDIRSTKQTDIAEFLGIDTREAHSASGDVVIAIKIWEAFLELIEGALS